MLPPNPSSIDNNNTEKTENPEKCAKEIPDDEAYSILAASEEPPIIPYNVKSGDPLPIPDGLPEEGNQFTFRAVAVGCLLGSVVQASNMYLGLKTGFTFGASLFGALFGYAFLKPLSKSKFPIFGGYFGPKENCTVQTAATASGGLGILFSTGVPAMYQLGLLSPNPKDDIAKLILFAMAGAFFGMAFAIPLRTHYVLRQKLLFPTPTATAIAIQRLHSGPEGEETGKKQVRCLGLAFTGSMSLRVLSQYLPGIVWKWHWGWWLYLMGAKQAVGIDNWTWYFEITPAFLGVGILTGLNASLSFYLGSLLAWGIIGPILVAKNIAYGSQRFPDVYPEIYDYQSLSSSFTTATHPSARYWLLWPGVLLLIVSSFTELGLNGKKMVMGIWEIARTAVNTVFHLKKKTDNASPDDQDTLKDPAAGNLVPPVAWGSLLVLSIILTCLVMKLKFQVQLGITLLAILLGFLFSFIGVQSCGDTDINPISTCAKASQLIIGGATHTYAIPKHALTVNLLSGMIAGAAANQTTDMVGDLRAGHLLGASPANQFYSQFVGSFFAIVLAPSLFVLFSQAYPCIIDLEAKTCEFGVPSVGAWRAVATAVTAKGDLPIPKSSAIFAVVISVVGMILTVVKYKVVPRSKRKFIPNMNAVGLGFVVNFTGYASAMALASILTYFWKKKFNRTYDIYAYSLAAGLMSGEGLGGVLNALFSVAGIGGKKYGSSALCPGKSYCG
ncbi:hypothetical protein PGT21_006799 [Puccinia graminis f. sp. tritici]|uniref:Oligopeptide transporter n=2 Tax=Puccinia graminis f. sp. tritici TaxID=56615 RepID=E3KKA2_PUCGT|nr:uncharacterized protein PGTG_10886 [Puccinia graminis f. sp. tritici CRL 75-36-700-3]EFP84727.2 hypothetical protein PGTG_10886 [Puccinia graminis f. sp. tritici CRL 75-36-700-3]KAA1088743.1 hypothetical protein PGTUg99_025389 [Puccinia graminis f. sp. tritici]KAA1101095.1 hypothetical protein PGT21_006799 [Puccinia graminis f. sp. tritici]